jgi:tRNA A-37 threonylcarbamoyl transferase component Bud32
VGSPDEPPTEILPASAERAASPKRVAPELIGRSLGKFTIVERLGKGGSGEVFRAEQQQLGRSAVIKVLRHEIASAPNRVERFLREARLASRLDHPYAAHIYAFGAEQDGVLWIAMEHVKGITLDALVARRGAIPAGVFAPLFARLCEVVHSAHELGIVHRDIKGANVMVIERAGQLLPKLLDFGIAKSDDAGTSPGVIGDADGLTGHGATLGSPHYMSPEQWERPHEVDARADIYALGVLAYRCCAGWLPFHTADRNELVEAHLHRAPPPLPDHVLPGIADAVMRALAKSADARWQSAIAFGEAIRNAAGVTAPEIVPILDPSLREAWLRAGPQPIADAIVHLTSATTTVEADAALRELVAITCRWLAVLALSRLPANDAATNARVRDQARAVIGRDDGGAWLRLARAAAQACPGLAGLDAALAGAEPLAQLADRVDDRERGVFAGGRATTSPPMTRGAMLANDIISVADALRPLEPLLAYQLAVGRADGGAESWLGPRRRDRERVVVWGEPLATGEVALLDMQGQVIARLSPLAQVIAPLPSAEPELFLLWRGGRGPARLVAAPWGFERADDEAGRMLAMLSTEDSDTIADPADDHSPYPGLASYTTDDAERFVGREREIEAIANRLVRAPLLAVLGPSGVGKSSFIAAGLVPRLGEQHRVLTMRPGRHPMHALAALPPVSADSHDELGLVQRLRELGESAQRGLVIVVDQLEELVTLCADPAERRRFAETLAAAADGPASPVRVVATLRDDFATVIEGEDAFRGKFEVFVLAAPSPDALRRIVVEPARRAGVAVEREVVEDMVEAIAGRPASLPLLSFTAAQLWQTRDKKDRRISHAAYLAIGGVAGALATYADELYGNLARRDQDTVRDLFSRLVALDGTRIPAPRSELEQLPGARAVLAHLIDARLLVVRDDDGTDVIEIVHECLAERWPRLARWRSEDEADRALLGDVRAAARRWNDAGRRADLLWRGQALAELRRLAARSAALTELERKFADAAVTAQQRARRIRRGIVAGAMTTLAGVAGVMAYLSIAANESRAQAEKNATAAHEAEHAAEQQLTTNLVAQGRRELNGGRSLEALAYFAAAMKRGVDTPAIRQMITVASRAWRDELLVFRDEPLNYIVGSPRGWFAAGSQGGKLYFWDDKGHAVATVTSGAGPIVMLVVNPDDSLLVVGRDAIVHLGTHHEIVRQWKPRAHAWHAGFGPAPDELSTVEDGAFRVYGLDGKLRREHAVALSQDQLEPLFSSGARFAIYTEVTVLKVLDLATMEERVLASNADGNVSGNRQGTMFAYFNGASSVQLVDATGHLAKRIQAPEGHTTSFFFSEDGTQIALAAEHELRLWSFEGKEIGAVAIEPDQSLIKFAGPDVWTGGADGVVRHYIDGVLVASLPIHLVAIDYGTVARDALATIGSDGTLVAVRAHAKQLVVDDEICRDVQYTSFGIATSYTCGTITHVYVGRHHIGDCPVSNTGIAAAFDPASGRGTIESSDGIRVFDEHGKLLAKSDKRAGTAFADADHLFVAEYKEALWRWTLSSNTWEKLMPLALVHIVVAVHGSPVIVGEDGKLKVLTGTQVTHEIDLGEHPEALTTSDDARWLAAQLQSGATAIIDTSTWQIVRKLPVGDNYGAAATFDAHGELIVRASHGAMSLWDAATGENLVFGFDVMRNLANARFLPDGRLEVDARSPGLVDLPRDTRPAAEVLAEIACRVPLAVQGGRLEPATPVCTRVAPR